MTNVNKTYSELIKLATFEERFRYLRLDGAVAKETFGFERYLNQKLYRDPQWRRIRDDIIVRDNGCDLGMEDRMIYDKILVHHINPITVDDIRLRRPCVFDPENLICTSHITHNAIHYGDEKLIIKAPVERTKNDTCPWRQK